MFLPKTLLCTRNVGFVRNASNWGKLSLGEVSGARPWEKLRLGMIGAPLNLGQVCFSKVKYDLVLFLCKNIYISQLDQLIKTFR